MTRELSYPGCFSRSEQNKLIQARDLGKRTSEGPSIESVARSCISSKSVQIFFSVTCLRIKKFTEFLGDPFKQASWWAGEFFDIALRAISICSTLKMTYQGHWYFLRGKIDLLWSFLWLIEVFYPFIAPHLKHFVVACLLSSRADAVHQQFYYLVECLINYLC